MLGLAAKSAGKAAEIDGGAWRSDPDRRRHGLYPPPGVVHGKTAVVLVSRRGAEIGQWIGLRCVPDCCTFGISGLIPELPETGCSERPIFAALKLVERVLGIKS